MATLNLTPEEFADIALMFLSDKAINPEKVATGNEHFNTFMSKNAPQIKNKLVKYYLDSNPQSRRWYKMIKRVFSGEDKKLQTLRIGPAKTVKGIRTDKRKARDIIKSLLKKEDIEKDKLDFLLEFFEED